MEPRLVRQGLATAALGVDGLTCSSTRPATVNTPHFFAGEMSIDPNWTYGGKEHYTVFCYLLAARADEEAGQEALDILLAREGPGSVRDALLAGRGEPGEQALAGACDDFNITAIDAYRIYEVGTIAYFGARITVDVYG